jgi:hypothetical protein
VLAGAEEVDSVMIEGEDGFMEDVEQSNTLNPGF